MTSGEDFVKNDPMDLEETLVVERCGDGRRGYVGVSRPGSRAWLGVLYGRVSARFSAAVAPAESLREGVMERVDASAYGPSAWQPGPGPAVGVRFDEQCLSLNIFVPAGPSREPRTEPSGEPSGESPNRLLPVLVWVHGGGYLGGGSAQPDFDGGVLAERQGIVVVTVNYRLGAFGMLDVRDLSRGADSTGPDTTDADSTGPGAPPAVANPGIGDLVLALEWVARHIAAFGGDPHRVSLAGQSAGAHAVACLLVAPEARGLFHRAIVQSAPPVALALEDARRVRDAVVAELGDAGSSVNDPAPGDEPASARAIGTVKGPERGLAVLRAASPERLVEASVAAYLQIARATPGVLGTAPVIDGVMLSGEPLAVLAEGGASAVPLLIGSNLDEMTSFADDPLIRVDPAALDRLGRPAVPAELAAAGVAARARSEATERWFRLPALAAAAGHARVAATWAYEFGVVPSGFARAAGGGPGATHGIEAGYVFGNTDRGMWTWLAPEGATAEDRRAIERIQAAWGAFVRGEDPGWASLGEDGTVHAFV